MKNRPKPHRHEVSKQGFVGVKQKKLQIYVSG